MASLNLRLAGYKGLQRLEKVLEDLESDGLDSLMASQLLKTLQANFDRFAEHQEILVAGSQDDAELTEHLELGFKADDIYNKCFVHLSQGLGRESSEGSNHSVPSHELKLEPLAIPSFDGELHNWLAFKDAFETLVHNTNYPEVYKLGKLREAIKSDVVPLIGGIYSGGYEEVWTALKGRYDNRKQLSEIHVQRFLNIPPIQEEGQKSLYSLVDAVEESLRALRVMGLPVESWDALTVPLLTSKLPSVTQKAWCMVDSPTEIPSLKNLLGFLQKRAKSLAAEGIKAAKKGDSSGRSAALRSHVAQPTSEHSCAYCSEGHRTTKCPQLLVLSAVKRFEAVKAKHLCHNCLRSGHFAKECPSGNCRYCGRKHHTLLCSGPKTSATASSNTESPVPNPSSKTADAGSSKAQEETRSTFFAVGESTVLLATARARVVDAYGNARMVRILCDPGSQVSFITDKMADLLGLKRQRHNLVVEGIGGLTHTRASSSVNLIIESCCEGFKLDVNALVLPAIAKATPTVKVNVGQWPHLAGLRLADPQFGIPGGIDMLLGADVWGLIVEDAIRHGDLNAPHAQLTRLGWVIFGPASTAATANSTTALTVQLANDALKHEHLAKVWQIDLSTKSDFTCRDIARIFDSTHFRRDDGRYVVHMPLRLSMTELGDSYTQALRQFSCLERRLAGDRELREKYISFMREYESLGHMERVSAGSDHKGCYYIPHHAVVDKFRVVFNASARTTSGLSLNDIQHVGPPIQDLLVNILLRFRQFRVALTADIEKMFRQILIAPEHRDLQRIVWRERPTDELQIFRLSTVTYGMASSPYNAVRTLHQCAYDNCALVRDTTEAVRARESILSDFYVDDWLTSCDSAAEILRLATNVDQILRSGHFFLRKWNSNEAEVLGALPRETPPPDSVVIDASATSVLGLRWHTASDTLRFKINMAVVPPTITKRYVLSEVAKLFDPTGILSPITICGRIFIQKLWSASLTWDQELPPDLRMEWLGLREGIEAINQISVPRWFGKQKNCSSELFGFCDASSRAYAAAVYVRSEAGGHVRVSLVAAASKVAPLKGATIPRLELCAAQLLSTLLHHVKVATEQSDAPTHCYTDSQIVLCWIQKHPAQLKPYVGNRVKTILDYTSPRSWHYIQSKSNPADCASRGLPAAQLLRHPLWWTGPSWLMKQELQCGKETDSLTSEEEAQMLSEVKPRTVVSAVSTIDHLTTRSRTGQIIPLCDRFSSLNSLLRTVVYMLRWLPRNKTQRARIIDAREIDAALILLIRITQGKFFMTEINCLRTSCSLPSSSPLRSLNPFRGEDGLLRLGGRIGQASLPADRRFPIILPKGSALVTLLVAKAHKDTLHGGTQVMLQVLRSRFWIVRARQAVRSYIQRCVVCRRHKGATLNQQMASLPRQRVNACRPFRMTGVDYCGPFTIRMGPKRSKVLNKTYVVIFVCMATKAVHLDVAEDLSASAFLDVFARFTSRRGPCSDLYSDNGTTFVGANRILQHDVMQWKSENNIHALSNMGTSWHFITPSAPHQGGLWEAAVKSAKYHLVRVVGAQVMWYGQLLTLAARIEACLNSRPIVPLYDDPDDRLALTPGDFLIGAPIISVPEPDVTTLPSNRVKHWQWLRRLQQEFWNKWSEDYLTTLQTRGKWQKPNRNLKKGDIVLIRGDNLPPTHWRMGRVVAVHPGKDGLVRNATVKTNSGVLSRAVQKLCLLLDPTDFEPHGSTGQDVQD